MRITTRFCCAMAVIGTTACAHKSIKIDPETSAALATRWNGTLAVPQDMAGVIQIRGNASMSAEGGQTRANIQINNAARGGVHPWHIHMGRCGMNGPVFGDASAYPLLKVDGNGRAVQDARLNVPLPVSGDYYVNVHASTENMQTIVACANLAPPAR